MGSKREDAVESSIYWRGPAEQTRILTPPVQIQPIIELTTIQKQVSFSVFRGKWRTRRFSGL